ncbi:hypothetical protein Tco_0485026 [Tanacetum coccineum]
MAYTLSSQDNICYKIARELIHSGQPKESFFTPNITLSVDYALDLLMYCAEVYWNTYAANKESGPMVWIGIYIAIASLVCTLAMAADLFHGLRNKKFWFPCKYFTLNAASITVITVAMKLPVDLTSEMPGNMDQTAKLGSLAFMCTIMVNLMPSLASMENKTLLANVVVKEKLFTPPIDSTGEINEDLSMYVLQINDEMELAERALKGISNSMNSFILKAEKEQNNGLLELLDWSLPIVTLTCIAVALSHIPKDSVMSLVKSVGEGLSYTHLVEESLNISSEYVNIRKATITLWHEVENNYKWLKNSLSKNAFEEMTATEILSWFSDKAEAIVIEINESSNGKMVENNIPKELIASNSMYRIAQTILLREHGNGRTATAKVIITMKCHESVIEKREASVKAAAKLLGNTTKIIERLETVELPSMEDDKMAYIDEWRLHFNQSIP